MTPSRVNRDRGQTVPAVLCQWHVPDNGRVTSEAPHDFPEHLITWGLFCLSNPHLQNEVMENPLKIPFISFALRK